MTTINILAFEFVIDLCGRLLLDYPDKLKGDVTPILKAILFAITVRSYQVRKKCLEKLKQLISRLGGVAIARGLLREYVKFMNFKLQVREKIHRIYYIYMTASGF